MTTNDDHCTTEKSMRQSKKVVDPKIPRVSYESLTRFGIAYVPSVTERSPTTKFVAKRWPDTNSTENKNGQHKQVMGSRTMRAYGNHKPVTTTTTGTQPESQTRGNLYDSMTEDKFSGKVAQGNRNLDSNPYLMAKALLKSIPRGAMNGSSSSSDTRDDTTTMFTNARNFWAALETNNEQYPADEQRIDSEQANQGNQSSCVAGIETIETTTMFGKMGSRAKTTSLSIEDDHRSLSSCVVASSGGVSIPRGSSSEDEEEGKDSNSMESSLSTASTRKEREKTKRREYPIDCQRGTAMLLFVTIVLFGIGMFLGYMSSRYWLVNDEEEDNKESNLRIS